MANLKKGMKIEVSGAHDERLNGPFLVYKGGAIVTLVFHQASSDSLRQIKATERHFNSASITMLNDDQARAKFNPKLAEYCGLNRPSSDVKAVKGKVYELTMPVDVGSGMLGAGGRVACTKGGAKPTFYAHESDPHHSIDSSGEYLFSSFDASILKEVAPVVDQGLERITATVTQSASSHPDSMFVEVKLYLDGGKQPAIIATDDGWGGPWNMSHGGSPERADQVCELVREYAQKVFEGRDAPFAEQLLAASGWNDCDGLMAQYAYHMGSGSKLVMTFAQELEEHEKMMTELASGFAQQLPEMEEAPEPKSSGPRH